MTSDRRRGSGLRLCQGLFRSDIEKFIHGKGWNRLPGPVMESPLLEIKAVYMWRLGTCFRGGLGAVGLVSGLSDLAGLFQPKLFCF